MNNPNLIKLKVGDLISLKEKVDKNEPRYAYRVEQINFPKNEAYVRRYSGLDVDSPDAKWISFKIIHSVVSKPIGMSLVEMAEIKNLTNKALGAINQIEFLPDEFEMEVHHSVNALEGLSLNKSLQMCPTVKSFQMEI